MKSIGKSRRSTTAAMDSPYRIGFDVGRKGETTALNPYPSLTDACTQWYDGFIAGHKLYEAVQRAKKEDLS